MGLINSQENPLQDDNNFSRVVKIVKGDPNAFESLFGEYCQPLINFAHSYVHDSLIAEDIVQEVFITVWKSRSKLDPSKNIKTYLFSAVKNGALNHLRGDAVRRQGADIIKLMDDEDIESVENAYIYTELDSHVQDAISELPDKCRVIFRMSRMDGMKYAEIADVLQLSVKTVETQMGRALKRLRGKLASYISILLP